MGSDYLWRGTLVVNGVVYDHIGFRRAAASTATPLARTTGSSTLRAVMALAYDDYGKPYPAKWDNLNFSAVLQHAQRRFRGEQGLFESLAYWLFNLPASLPPIRSSYTSVLSITGRRLPATSTRAIFGVCIWQSRTWMGSFSMTTICRMAISMTCMTGPALSTTWAITALRISPIFTLL